MHSAHVLKNLLSKFRLRTSPERVVVTDYSQLSVAEVATLYDESYSTLQRYVDFAWEDLQAPRPAFGAFQEHALSIEISHKLFIKYYGDYLGLVRELNRCGIHQRSLSPAVEKTIHKVALASSP